uniref:Diacylglycerol lipase-beta n=1 Tax=Denticeps clupeoides TaxID=299321 RepID=A0AAY4EWJ4_9TELE
MPGIVAFGRRWGIASDDLVFPGAFELLIRVLWWIGTLALYIIHKGHFECPGGAVLHRYLVVLLVLLGVIILSLCAIVYVSAQGKCCPSPPRRRASAGISRFSVAAVAAVLGAVISSWIIFISMAIGVVVVFDPLGSQRQGATVGTGRVLRDMESSESEQFLQRARSLAARVWECRLRLLCCCLPPDDNHRAAFSNIGQLFSSFFSDTDLVVSDIAAGLALLHQEQDKMDVASGSFDDLDVALESATHWMRFAEAAYGWPLYVYSHPFTGPCRLTADCCGSRGEQYDMVGGENMGCHFTSILQTTGLQYRDFIHISYHNQIYEIPFYIALDHKKEAVLVAVRGTLSLKDVLTDLSAECENLPIEGVSGACYAHKGMCQAAGYLYRRLVNDGILSQAFSIAPEYRLVIVGHSLGAGTASLLAALLRSTYPTLQCYAFSPPGGLMSKALAEYSRQFVVSVVLGKDLVPRLSIPNMEDLKRRILKIVSNCNKPKYRILLQGCWYEMFGGVPDDSPTELDIPREEELSRPLLGGDSLLHHSPSYHSLTSDPDFSPSPTHQTHLPLYLPGRIIYITEDGPPRRSCWSQASYRSEWANEMAFRSVLISPRMLADHMPDVVHRALQGLERETQNPLCPSAQSNSHLNVI